MSIHRYVREAWHSHDLHCPIASTEQWVSELAEEDGGRNLQGSTAPAGMEGSFTQGQIGSL